ncbi:MarR family winged helix-turn-helix transcriptional regulator [Phenylobacterium montanum]|uniref:MarR family transcriptional regulator n=1 Tax=Phenylobacterium montanum TaxID=2823693 RepID=A0A975IV86_9CAUL|nr:MarR family transcriptional regulator [Caulobacter sp. S6]QUD88319.1 MarR family transcriptional regulator [Caulobacter sp. S6]
MATRRSLGGDIGLGDLENQVGFLLRLAQVSVFKHLIAALEPFDLRLTDYSALLVIEANPELKQQSLGEALRIQRPNLVSIMDALERRGLVKRGSVPGDRRSYALTLTPEGSALLARANEAQARHEADVDAALGPIDKAAFLDALARLSQLSDGD